MVKSKDWQFAQSFGTEEDEDQEFLEEDIFTALDFDSTGKFIALGDKAGRVTVFVTTPDEGDGQEEKEADAHHDNNHSSSDGSSSGGSGHHKKKKKKKRSFRPIEYGFYTEFQSHERGFDRLHSVPIEEAINMIRFWPSQQAPGLFMLTTNDTTIKLWKLSDKKVVKQIRSRSSDGGIVVPPPDPNAEFVTVAQCKRQFPNAHGTCHIDSISVNSDGETFISTDALKINMWNLGVGNICFNLIDIKPPNLANLSEVITAATFHPTQCNLMQYATSLGAIRLCDLRDRALQTKDSAVRSFRTAKGDGFFSEVVESISDSKFTPDGRHILARDYLTTKLWDIRMEKKPLVVFPVHDYLEEYLSELHQNDCIFDKFECASSADGSMFVTGSYDSNFVVHEAMSKKSQTIHATSEVLKKHKRKFSFRSNKKEEIRARVAKMDFAKKSLHVCWHPVLNCVAIASLNKVYIYQAP